MRVARGVGRAATACLMRRRAVSWSVGTFARSCWWRAKRRSVKAEQEPVMLRVAMAA